MTRVLRSQTKSPGFTTKGKDIENRPARHAEPKGERAGHVGPIGTTYVRDSESGDDLSESDVLENKSKSGRVKTKSVSPGPTQGKQQNKRQKGFDKGNRDTSAPSGRGTKEVKEVVIGDPETVTTGKMSDKFNKRKSGMIIGYMHGQAKQLLEIVKYEEYVWLREPTLKRKQSPTYRYSESRRDDEKGKTARRYLTLLSSSTLTVEYVLFFKRINGLFKIVEDEDFLDKRRDYKTDLGWNVVFAPKRQVGQRKSTRKTSKPRSYL